MKGKKPRKRFKVFETSHGPIRVRLKRVDRPIDYAFESYESYETSLYCSDSDPANDVPGTFLLVPRVHLFRTMPAFDAFCVDGVELSDKAIADAMETLAEHCYLFHKFPIEENTSEDEE